MNNSSQVEVFILIDVTRFLQICAISKIVLARSWDHKVVWRSGNPMIALAHSRVSWSSRPQHWDRLVVSCKWHSFRSRQWQHFCASGVRSFFSFWYYWLRNSPLSPQVSFRYSVYCTSGVSVRSLRQISVDFSQQLVFATTTAHLWCAAGLGAGTLSLRPVHYTSVGYLIIANHSVNRQLFADKRQL